MFPEHRKGSSGPAQPSSYAGPHVYFRQAQEILHSGQAARSEAYHECGYAITSSTGQWSEPITSGWIQALRSRSRSFSDAMK